MNFYQEILAAKKMILALAPMDGVSDFPFRFINKKYGQMDLIFTEFVSVEGVCHSHSTQILNHFDFDETQRPLVAQIFGRTPVYFKQVAVLLCELGVDGIDINMGCPSSTVSGHGYGAGLIQTPLLVQEIIRAVQGGIQDWSQGLKLQDCPDISPKMQASILAKKEKFALVNAGVTANRQKLPTVSIKTRIGYAREEIASWLPYLLEMRPAAIALHGRTFKQGYSGKADWSAIGRAATLTKSTDPSIIFLGNGDVTDYEQAQDKVLQYGVDGVLIGRASFGRPFIFLPPAKRQQFLAEKNIFQIALEHAQLYEATYAKDEKYSFSPMRKHLAWYTKGVDEAATIRAELVRTNNALEVAQILQKYHLI
jgi:tRNA-dihydrouridine synthase